MFSTRQELLEVPVPLATKSYSPVSHADVITSTMNYIKKSNYNIRSEEYRTANNGQRVIGKILLESPDPELNYMIAFKNSYDKSMSLGFAAGTAVFVCSNGMVVSNQPHNTVARKHTGDVREEFYEKLGNAFANLNTEFEIVRHDRERMREAIIDKRTASELVGRMVMEEEILNTMQMNIIRKAMDKDPYFNWGGQNETTVWNFYNNITEALKTSYPTTYIQNLQDSHQFVTEELLA
jgi:hypothetical protein